MSLRAAPSAATPNAERSAATNRASNATGLRRRQGAVEGDEAVTDAAADTAMVNDPSDAQSTAADDVASADGAIPTDAQTPAEGAGAVAAADKECRAGTEEQGCDDNLFVPWYVGGLGALAGVHLMASAGGGGGKGGGAPSAVVPADSGHVKLPVMPSTPLQPAEDPARNEPTSPAQPSTPVAPAEPVMPAVPVTPVTPVEPAKPSEPATPINPTTSPADTDTTPPDALTLTTSTGKSTINGEAVLQVSGIEAGATVQVRYNGGDVWHEVTTAQVSLAGLKDGINSIEVRQIDTAGNVGPVTLTEIVLDTVPPEVTLNAPTVTNQAMPTLTGTAPAGGKVQLFDGETLIGEAVADGQGHWSVTPSEPLSESLHVLTAKTADDAGNVGRASANVTVDVTKPVITYIAPHYTSDTTPEIKGTAPSNSIVEVYDYDTYIGQTKTDANGNWSYTFADPLQEGRHGLLVTVLDDAGNENTAGDVLIVDTTPPDVTLNTPATTNNAGTEIRGTAEAFRDVAVHVDGNLIGTVRTDIAGNWSLAPQQPLSEGPHTISATATDLAGNQRSVSSPLTIDLTKPSLTIDSPAATNDTTPTIKGTGEVGSNVIVSDGGVELGRTTVGSDGRWEVTPTQPLQPGLHRVYAEAVDGAGNQASVRGDVEVDLTAPSLHFSQSQSSAGIKLSGWSEEGSVVSIFDGATKLGEATFTDSNYWTFTADPAISRSNLSLVAKGSDAAGNTKVVTAPTLTVNVAALTNDATPTWSGTAPPNAGVVVSDATSGQVLKFLHSDANGNWSFTPDQGLSEGIHHIAILSEDGIGNANQIVTLVTVDLTAPPVTIAAPAFTNDTTPELKGTAPANAIVSLFDGADKLGDVVADSSGAWSFTVLQPLTETSHSITAKTQDAAGNVGSESVTVVVDVTNPTVTIDSPALTRDSSASITGTGEVGSTISVSDGARFLKSAVVGADGRWKVIPGIVLPHGIYQLRADAVDSAGNQASASQTLEVDTKPPFLRIAQTQSSSGVAVEGYADAGSMVSIFDGATKLGDATFTNAHDWTFTPDPSVSRSNLTLTAVATDAAGNRTAFSTPAMTIKVASLTNDSTPTWTGTAPPNAAVTINYFTTFGFSSQLHADSNGQWTFTPKDALSEGVQNVRITVNAGGGNTSTIVTPVEIDVTPPSVSVTAPVLTNDNTPTISGTAPASSVVELFEGTTKLGEATADTNGAWTFTPSQKLQDGPHLVTAAVTDAAGNRATQETGVEIDTTAPSLTLTAPALTNDSTPDISGVTDPFTSVTISEGGNVLGNVTSGADGRFTFTPSQPLSDTSHTIVATVEDDAANQMTRSATITVDTVAPNLTLNVKAMTIDKTPDMTGVTEANRPVDIYSGQVKIGSTTSDAQGVWSFSPSQDLSLGHYDFSAKVADAAGNLRSVDRSTDIVVPVNNFSVDASTSPNGRRPITGTADPGYEFDLFLTDDKGGEVLLGHTQADSVGNWTFTPPNVLAPGNYGPVVYAVTPSDQLAVYSGTYKVL